VLLRALRSPSLPAAVAPGLAMLGFMLPTSPLHVLLLRDFGRPVVMTSGNLADEPQIINDDQARAQFDGIASQIVWHNRAIANRIDDSVVRFMGGKPHLIRRARGYAPSPFKLPAGFENAPEILAMGGEVKAAFCLIKAGEALLSQHQGDLENPVAFDDYRKNLDFYSALFDHVPEAVAADMHPEYLSSKLARTMPGALVEVQHHHAHIAACLCENAYPLNAAPVLGVALDGLGWGSDGSFWGGEFLLADYSGFHRLAAFKPVAMPGGARAVREPWRNLYAHISAAMGWETFSAEFAQLEAFSLLEPKPRATLDAMISRGLNAPTASSCGRLFDAVAAALGLCADRQSYEGDAAARLEALAQAVTNDPGPAYPFALSAADDTGFRRLDPAPMWRGMFEDFASGVPATIVASRFHRGLAETIVATSLALTIKYKFRTIALSGGCFQNALLFHTTFCGLRKAGFQVLIHTQVPANDGGLALGQGVVAAAQLLHADKRIVLCA
jgi:hydrogenase maturation protein HypF